MDFSFKRIVDPAILENLPWALMALAAVFPFRALGNDAGAPATTWHVSASRGSDAADGKTAATGFASLQRGLDAAGPGDTVLIQSGTYYGHVELKKGGTADKPLRIVADEVKEGRVVLTGAVRSIREGEVRWELVDASLGLYRVPFEYRPTRVLANQADLLPYPSLDDLKAFRFVADDYPGCLSGYAWDKATRALYVRLRADGAYGPIDPNKATMAVSPPPADGPYGNIITREDSWNLALPFKGSAHVVIDGITFETPGMAGIYTKADDLLVRNCWFFGCRFGVAGQEPEGEARPVDRVAVEQCYYTQYPAFSDAEDVIRRSAGKEKGPIKAPVHWQRKAGLLPISGGPGRAFNHETGLTRAMGMDWVIRRNYIYEVFEAFSSGSVSSSIRADIYENRFERICDNAVETEDHARDIRIHRNFIVDVFEPFSWQPRSGTPLPGPVAIYDNVVWQTEKGAALWAANGGGAIKMGASDRNWQNGRMGDIPKTVSEAPGGFWFVNNTLLLPNARALTLLNAPERRYAGFYLLNNILCVRGIAAPNKPLTADACGLVTEGNVVALSRDPSIGSQPFPSQAEILAGKGGRVAGAGQFTVTDWSSSPPRIQTDMDLDAPPSFVSPPAFIPKSPRRGAPLEPFPVGPQTR